MLRTLVCSALISAAYCAGTAAAELANPADAEAYSDLPMAGGPRGHGLIPGVGPTPGVVIEVDSPRSRCSADAIKAADGLMTPEDAVRTCNRAIIDSMSPDRGLAGTHVNRGVLLLTMRQVDDAKRDFERALEINPDSAEALANRGGLKVVEGHAAEGIVDLDRAIALGTDRPERAYYHRALGREDLGDLRGAYQDYRMAQTLKPDWDAPTRQLSRFQLRPAGP